MITMNLHRSIGENRPFFENPAMQGTSHGGAHAEAFAAFNHGCYKPCAGLA